MQAQKQRFIRGALQDCRPLLKWAGGKTQLLAEIIPKMPNKYGRYIEPFFGGGALFFSVRPTGGVIADSNPELVNLYQSVHEQCQKFAIEIVQTKRYISRNGMSQLKKFFVHVS